MVPREHHRVRIRLPARLRWTPPFGQKIELSETVDVSRGGLLASSKESHAVGKCLPAPCAVMDYPPLRGRLRWRFISKGRHRTPRDPERRGSPRRSLAVPIRVRPENVPWFEETMSLDFSPRGMRFRSHREYPAGELLRIALEDPSSGCWRISRKGRACFSRGGRRCAGCRRLPRNLVGHRAYPSMQTFSCGALH